METLTAILIYGALILAGLTLAVKIITAVLKRVNLFLEGRQVP